MNTKRLDWDFDYHTQNRDYAYTHRTLRSEPPDANRTDANRAHTHQTVRNKLHRVALELNDLIPDGREKSLMITKLEEAMFWANAGIARQDRPEDAR